jgi:hypothetical protein
MKASGKRITFAPAVEAHDRLEGPAVMQEHSMQEIRTR